MKLNLTISNYLKINKMYRIIKKEIIGFKVKNFL